jgi:hypothetical protein
MKYDLRIFFDFIGRPRNEVMPSTEHTKFGGNDGHDNIPDGFRTVLRYI